MRTTDLTRIFLILVIATTIFSCSKDDNPQPAVDESNLISAIQVDSKTAAQLRALIGLSGRNLDPSIFKYDVRVFKVTYNTTYKDNEIVASGLIALPTTTDAVGMLSLQHGTIVQHSLAPSAQPAGSFDLTLYAAVASSGLVTIVPDMIGFGESKSVFHPYYVEEPTATAILDNIRAATKLIDDNNITFNSKLFLAGYSQGGYGTMAAHKAIEEDGLDGFQLIASFPAAGGYDLKAVQEYFFGLEQYDQPYYMAYVAKSYQTFYGYNSLLTDFFNEPYASRIPDLLNGVNGQTTINDQLTTHVPTLVKADVLANIDTDPKFIYLVSAFKANSLTDWRPTIPMFMYHGTADITVPFENSQITYEKLLANGGSGVVTLIPLEGKDHATGVEPYIDDVITRIQPLK